jgi:hypothetical protein
MKLQANVLKRNSMRFAAALVAALASFVASPNTVLAAAPQHHDQAPGFYRLKVGDLEVTALYDGTGVFDPHWLNGTKTAMDGVAQALHEDPHMLDVIDTGFLANTGKQLILVDAGAGGWWGGGALGRLAGHTGYEFSSKGQRILFWGDIVHAQRVQLQHPEITATFDIDQTAASAMRNQLLPKLVREGVLIAVPHSSFFPPLGHLRKEGSGYSWAPVVFTDQWNEE